MPLYWSTLWRLLHYWFLPLFLCGMLIGQALGYGQVLRDFSERIGRYNTKKHNIIAPSQLETQKSDLKWTISEALPFLNIVLLPVILVLLLIALHTYATQTCIPSLSPVLVGDFGYVRFVFEKDKVPTDAGRLPMYQENMSRSVRLLGDAGSGYAFLGSDEKRQYAGIVDKSLVRGLLAAEKEQSPNGLAGAAGHEK